MQVLREIFLRETLPPPGGSIEELSVLYLNICVLTFYQHAVTGGCEDTSPTTLSGGAIRILAWGSYKGRRPQWAANQHQRNFQDTFRLAHNMKFCKNCFQAEALVRHIIFNMIYMLLFIKFGLPSSTTVALLSQNCISLMNYNWMSSWCAVWC